ncbi:hypothetical protein Lser_V15G29795 [Lactuca serriola]
MSERPKGLFMWLMLSVNSTIAYAANLTDFLVTKHTSALTRLFTAALQKMKLLTALCFPYVLARRVFPVFGYPLVVNSAVYSALIHLGLLELDYLFGLLQQLDVGFQLTFGQPQSAE